MMIASKTALHKRKIENIPNMELPMYLRAMLTTSLPLFSVVVVSQLLQSDGDMSSTDLMITMMSFVIVLCVIGCSSVIAPDKRTSTGARAWRIGVSAFIAIVFFWPVLFTGAIDGGMGWVVGIFETCVIGLVVAVSFRFCCGATNAAVDSEKRDGATKLK